jgi:4-hydroxy 2-oxovalerate aldolase
MKNIILSDPTLRDGNHAVRHQISREQVAIYCKAADAANIPIVEVGHGNGMGASSLQVGLAKETDEVLLSTARENLKHSKLGVHVIPGFATCERNIQMGIDIGVDLFRIASHCTEADTTRNHIAYARDRGKEVYGVLMMSHMASPEVLAEEALKMQSYGAEAVVIMDSAGAYMPSDVEERIKTLKDALKIEVGFHGHNNMGMAVYNSLVAANCGATILDGCARGFGAGAGNTQLEVLAAVLEKEGYRTGVDLYKVLDCGDIAEKELMEVVPTIKSTSIVSGMAGVFSGFSRHVEREAKLHDVDPRDIFFKLGERGVVAGQEDVIVEVAIELAERG